MILQIQYMLIRPHSIYVNLYPVAFKNFPTQIEMTKNSHTQKCQAQSMGYITLAWSKTNTSAKQPSLPVPRAVLDLCPSSIRTCRVAASFPFLWPTNYCSSKGGRLGEGWGSMASTEQQDSRLTSSNFRMHDPCQKTGFSIGSGSCRVAL